MTCRTSFAPVLVLALLCFLVPAARAEKVTVGQGGLLTIQQAVDAVLANTDQTDTILIPSGTYEESVLVSFASLTGTNFQEKLTIKRKGTSGLVKINPAAASNAPAIHLQDVDGVNLEHLTLESSDATDGIAALVIDGQSSNIGLTSLTGVAGDDVGVTVLGATTFGVRFELCEFSAMLGIGFWIDGVSHSLTECEASACGLNAVVLPDTSLNCRLKKCRAEALNGQNALHPGMITVRGSGHRLESTFVSGGGLDGIFVAGQGHLLKGCEAKGNGISGYNVNAAEAWLKNCKASQNLFGLSGGGEGATVEGGSYKSNASHGVFVMQSGTRVQSVAAKQNGGHGVYVVPGVVGTHVRSCRFEKNGGEAVLVEGQLTWLEGNKAESGDGLIDHGTFNGGFDNSVTDGGTNDF